MLNENKTNTLNSLIEWVKEYFKGNDIGKAVIGISGGKDSTIAAGILVKALGADRVVAVMMPCGEQSDISDSYEVCDFLNIPTQNRLVVNIGSAFADIRNEVVCGGDIELMNNRAELVFENPIVNTNLPSRLRMCTLYTVAAMFPNSRVVNTSNYSERYIGYSTKWGDGVGDFSLFGLLTVREVLAIGDELGLPKHLVHKTPADGMSGKSDEEKIGFSYNDLDSYILGDLSVTQNVELVNKINKMHNANMHKLNPIPTFVPNTIPLTELWGGT